ncbi:DNA repair protein RecO [Oharaeibacter diazotrophicus]|uniref:DNA repair protein RecO n=1 Tax=Oharaeibacter diazotrophicus TaxID=1920512 RepID=A0A4R6RK88_9HYPH|nr:DNA repair protein RecO [Oharaeibacter diazotrophicus]TDP86884.1 DNA replication and repair protein RecO [Oharaeibacter diazotrophicus]BBE71173.1 DNA repair protein RecO [Pleomorphomonas sp. SM30]GLS77928.1 DNA repair protein RecO [Oharaeibacter diazotrophicus]
MEWTADAVVLGARPHGESSVVLEVMTAEHGRHLGLVKGGRSRRMQPMLQPGNTLRATWRARLDSHLGLFTAETLVSRAATLMASAVGLHGVQVIAAHLRYLPERDPHPALHSAAGVILDHLSDPADAVRLIVRFELALLDELGFGLDLSRCAATGADTDLAWVSPKTGRAVGREAGLPWRDRLLPLPPFLLDPTRAERPDAAALRAALALTGHFLDRHVAGPRSQPLSPSRAALAGLLEG